MNTPNYNNILRIGIRNSTYKARRPRSSINSLRIILTAAVVLLFVIVAVGRLVWGN